MKKLNGSKYKIFYLSMKKIFLISIIFIFIFVPLYVGAVMGEWQDTDYLSKNPSVGESLDVAPHQFEDINTIKYDIDLGRKEKSRIIFSAINVDTYINTSKDTVIERFKITYYVDDITNPDLIGEKIFFNYCAGFDKKYIESCKNTKIVAVNAPGWEINNTSTFAALENKESKILGNIIYVWVAVKDQSKFKRREFSLYNRDVVDFKTSITIDDNYEFTRFEPSLPYEFKPEDELNSYVDLWDLERNSFVILQQIIKNKIDFVVRLSGDNYLGSNSFSYGKPKKVIEFNYSYDYQEDVNAKIVEENKNSTNSTLSQIKNESQKSIHWAIFLFVITFITSICSLYVSLFPKKSKHIINWSKYKVIHYYKLIGKFIEKCKK
jgi:hypothetical protein